MEISNDKSGLKRLQYSSDLRTDFDFVNLLFSNGTSRACRGGRVRIKKGGKGGGEGGGRRKEGRGRKSGKGRSFYNIKLEKL